MTVSKNDVSAEIGVDLRPDSELTSEEIIVRRRSHSCPPRP